VLLLILNLPLVGVFVSVLRLPQHVLATMVLLLCLVGAYSLNNSQLDLWVLVGFGIFGYGLRKLTIDPSPLVVALVLGPMMEKTLRQSLFMARGNVLEIVSRPLTLTLLILGLVALVAPLVVTRLSRRSISAAPAAEGVDHLHDPGIPRRHLDARAQIGRAPKVAGKRSARQAAQAGRERARGLAEEIGARIGELAGVAVAPQGADRADPVDLRGQDIAGPVADHDGALGLDHLRLDQVREQVDLGVEPPTRLRSVDGGEMPGQREVAHDADGRVQGLRGGHEHEGRAPRRRVQHLGDAVVHPVLEEPHVVVAGAVVRQGFLDERRVLGVEQGRQGPA